jgi:lysophospholipase L1-like esterase
MAGWSHAVRHGATCGTTAEEAACSPSNPAGYDLQDSSPEYSLQSRARSRPYVERWEVFMTRFTQVVVAMLTLSLAPLAHAQTPSAALPQRWILAGDSIQAQVFANAEFNLAGGDARDLTAAIVMQDTGVAIQNVSSPGATMTTTTRFFPGLKDQRAMLQYIHGFFRATGIIITIGVNDANGSVAVGTFQNDYAGLASFARGLGMQVICVPPLNEPGEVADVNVSRRFAFQLATVFACMGAGVPQENIFNPAAVGIVPNPSSPANRRLFASSRTNGQLVLDNVHLSSAGHRLFADRLIDFMVARGFWKRR